MFSSIRSPAGGSAWYALVDLRAAPGRRRRPISAARASDSAAVAWTSQMRTSTVPNEKWGRTDHQTCVNSMIERVAISSSM